MTIVQLATAERSHGAGNWRVEISTDNDTGDTLRRIYHYGTMMLSVRENEQGIFLVHADLGHGSVSDQQGMNQLFKALRLPLYFSRNGGAEIIETAR